jgi:hypothetical protein
MLVEELYYKLETLMRDGYGSHNINMLVPDTCRMKDVLEKYVLRIGLGPEVIDNAVYFLYGGNKIKKNEKRTIREMFMLNGAVIIVIDKKGVIGA